LKYYLLYGLMIRSEVELPCDYHMEVSDEKVDVTVRHSIGKLNEFEEIHLVERKYDGHLRSYYTGNGILICASDNIRIFAEDSGREIVVDTDNDLLQEAALFIIGLMISICIIFRENVPLHASGMEMNNKIYAFLASSGTGKSTLLHYLQNNGGSFVTDDVLPIHFNHLVIGQPSYSLHSKLWGSTLENLYEDITPYTRIMPHIDKYWVPIREEHRLMKPCTVSTLYVLSPSENADNVYINQITGTRLFTLLLENTQGIWAVPPVIQKRLFPQYSKILQKVKVCEVVYKKSYKDIHILVDTLVREMQATNNSSVKED